MWTDDPREYKPSTNGIVKGRFKNDRKAVALIIPDLGVVFVSTQHGRLSLSIATDAEIRSEGR